FRVLGVEEVYTGHCTGLRAEAEFLKAYGDRFHKLHSGMVIEFG
ncbi:MAG TPA: MBL fold metallo-hydrolase, partial [Thermococcus paralvinellae]|nr:MBL fold metallo-hydrolase [Thermococcus paralvinellae]